MTEVVRFEFAKLHGLDMLGFRVGGVGLANLLFPWARACAASVRHSTLLIRPTWPQLKVGPLLRGELDPRMYIGLFKVLPDEVLGLRRLGLVSAVDLGMASRCGIRIHAGMDGHFDGFLAFRAPICERLKAHCYDLPDEREYAALSESIGVHVRLGDFQSAADPLTQIRAGSTNTRLPLDWYVRRMTACLARTDGPRRFAVFSDGADDEIREILAVQGAYRVRSRDALSDMLRLASCQSLIASNSTYSMWAAFLMNRPSQWFPGSLRVQVNQDPELAREVI